MNNDPSICTVLSSVMHVMPYLIKETVDAEMNILYKLNEVKKKLTNTNETSIIKELSKRCVGAKV